MTDTNQQQAWLVAAYAALRAKLLPSAPERVLVSYGFPRSRGRGKAIGQCWGVSPAGADAVAVIFIHPCQWRSATDVLHVLLHEMVHAAVGCEHGHKAPFARVARALGLEGKMTATVPSAELQGELESLADTLPHFPPAAFDPTAGAARKGSRLRLWECPSCNQKARVASDNWSARCNDCCEDYIQVS